MENHSASSDSKDPASFLSSIIGVPVTVKLNSGVVYKGELQSVDGYMNIALEKCQEFVNGQLRRTYGDAFVRGNNGEFCCVRWLSCLPDFSLQCFTSRVSEDSSSVAGVSNPLGHRHTPTSCHFPDTSSRTSNLRGH